MSAFAFVVSPDGTAREIDINTISDFFAEEGYLWADADPMENQTCETLFPYFQMDSSLQEMARTNALRPRIEEFEDHLFLSLRGVNYHDEDCLEDMVNLRLILFKDKILTLHTRELKSVQALHTILTQGKKFSTPVFLLAQLLAFLNERLGSEIEKIEDDVTRLEELSLEGDLQSHQEGLSEHRRILIGLHKYVTTQAAVLQRLWTSRLGWIKKRERAELKNQAERLSTHLDELENLRQRCNVLQEEIKSALSDHMNKSMYRLTIVATVMLPLGLFAGLMGANVGGMPYTNSPYGFWIICAMCIALAGAMFAVLKWLKWI